MNDKILKAFGVDEMKQVIENLHIFRHIFSSAMYTFLLLSSRGMSSEEMGRSSVPVELSHKRSRESFESFCDNCSDDEDEEADDDERNDADTSGTTRSEKRNSESHERKSMSVERTFSAISSLAEQRTRLRELCDLLEEDLKRSGLRAKKFTLKCKDHEFLVVTRTTQNASRFIDKADEFYPLLDAQLLLLQPISVRLLGVRASIPRQV